MTVTVSRLENGLTIVTDTMPHIKTAAVALTVNAGARHETQDQHGIAHMLEHMAFKGTATRSAAEIVGAIERVGGSLNAATSHENTVYAARTLAEDVPLAITLIADILENSRLEADELAREQGVVLSEIGEAEDTPDDLVFEMMSEAAFPNQPLGRPILGTRDSVRAMTPNSIREYLAAHYRPGAMILSASGAVDHAAIVAQAGQVFRATGSQPASDFDKAAYAGGVAARARDLDQTHLVLGFESAATGSDGFFAADIAATVLGGGMSSRLFQEAREKRGLCYSIYAFNWGFADTGLFGIYAGAAPDDIDELSRVISGEIAGLMENASDEEISAARAQSKAGLLMSLENCASRAEQIARHLVVFGEVLSADALVARLDAVTPQDVRQIMGSLATPTASIVGPNASLASAQAFAAHFQP
ncbi:MAG: M16 family metallopeptidase [Candidatus Phaeomarinobacter sp.]